MIDEKKNRHIIDYIDPFAPPETEKIIRERQQKIESFRSSFNELIPNQRAACEAIINWLYSAELKKKEERRPLCLFLVGMEGHGYEIDLAVGLISKYFSRNLSTIDLSTFNDPQTASASLVEGLSTSYRGEEEAGQLFRRVAGSFDVVHLKGFDESTDSTVRFNLAQILENGTIFNRRFRHMTSFCHNIFILSSTRALEDIYKDRTRQYSLATNVNPDEIAHSLRSREGKSEYGDSVGIYDERIISLLLNNTVIFDKIMVSSKITYVKRKISDEISYIFASDGVRISINDDTNLARLITLSCGISASVETLLQASVQLIRFIYRKAITNNDKLSELVINQECLSTSTDNCLTQFVSGALLPRVLVCGRDNCFADMLDGTVELFFNTPINEIPYMNFSSAIIDAEYDECEGTLKRLSTLGIPAYIYSSSKDKSLLTDLDRYGYIESCDNNSNLSDWIRTIAECAKFNQVANELGRRNRIVIYRVQNVTCDDDGKIVLFNLGDFKTELSLETKHKGRFLVDFPKVGWNDIVGLKEQISEVQDFVDDMKREAELIRKGIGRRGAIILSGPAGCGKTHLARAMASSADVAFIACSGCDFIKPYAGEGIRALKEAFAAASAARPCLLFIDEIDLLIRQRGGATNTDEITNELLVLLDSFESEKYEGVYLFGATNFALDDNTLLDRAALSRFARKIEVPLPRLDDRIEFIKKYFSKHGLVLDEQSLESVASRSVGLSFRDLKHISDTSLRLYINKKISISDALLKAFEQYNDGYENTERKLDEIWQVCIHEASHAFVGVYLLGYEAVNYLTCVQRGNKAGYIFMSKEDKLFLTKAELLSNISVCLAGRIAEQMLFGEKGINSMSVSDIQSAAKLARQAVMLGFEDFYLPTSDHDAKIEELTGKILAQQRIQAEDIVRNNIETIKFVAERLREAGSISNKEFIEVIKQAEAEKGE